jgi:hypothetical protein
MMDKLIKSKKIDKNGSEKNEVVENAKVDKGSGAIFDLDDNPWDDDDYLGDTPYPHFG